MHACRHLHMHAHTHTHTHTYTHTHTHTCLHTHTHTHTHTCTHMHTHTHTHLHPLTHAHISRTAWRDGLQQVMWRMTGFWITWLGKKECFRQTVQHCVRYWPLDLFIPNIPHPPEVETRKPPNDTNSLSSQKVALGTEELKVIFSPVHKAWLCCGKHTAVGQVRPFPSSSVTLLHTSFQKHSHHSWSPIMWSGWTPLPLMLDMYMSSPDITACPRTTGALAKRTAKDADCSSNTGDLAKRTAKDTDCSSNTGYLAKWTATDTE